MKKITAILILGGLVFGTSCKKYLDVNENPNQATSASAEVVLPTAITGTAFNLNSYNSYGAQIGGYMANAGGYGGFGSNVTYQFGTNDYAGLWSGTYDNLEDYQLVMDYTEGNLDYNYFNGAARIMKAFNFQMLVDTYNDVPYSEALKGLGNLTPKYDDAEVIYADLAAQLDLAIADIRAAMADQETNPTSNVKNLDEATDPMFKGDMVKWIQFANTVKLRLMIRAFGLVQFANTTFDEAGFITADAKINPGFTKDNGKQNPSYNSWVFHFDGSAGNRAWIPTKFIMGYYDEHHILDQGRGYASFAGFPSTPVNQLGFESTTVPSSPSASAWKSDYGTLGILKGPSMGQVAMLAAESYFLQAEGVLKGLIAGDVKSLFDAGVLASYYYIYQFEDGTYDLTSWNPETDYYDLYLPDNEGNYLVHIDLAQNADEQLEAIITQKFIAVNMINSQEGWNEYRRTHYPKIVPGTNDGYNTFASTQSVSPRPDRLPSRILYPASEASYNPENRPVGIDVFSSQIFWAMP